ncbi:MAG: glycosyltransferase family 2 protein [Acidobacteria bacterium]|nr:glycosyltransferase family 2 protein [Acidobacteriota bacterium]
MAAPDLELSVVIPCLNEAATIGACVRRAIEAMQQHGISGEVVVSDNGSDDGSVALARQAGARVVSCPARGYGAALQWGFRHARGRYVLMGDADQSYDFSLLPRFFAEARAGARFVIGSRLRGRIEPGAMPRLHRYLGTPVLTWILNRLFATRISDCNCGMRCIERDLFFDGRQGRRARREYQGGADRLLQGPPGPPSPSPLVPRRLAASAPAALARPRPHPDGARAGHAGGRTGARHQPADRTG